MQLEKAFVPGGTCEALFGVGSSHWQAEQGCSLAQVRQMRRPAAAVPLMAILGLGIMMISGKAGGNGKDGVGMAAIARRGVIPVGGKVNGRDHIVVLLVSWWSSWPGEQRRDRQDNPPGDDGISSVYYRYRRYLRAH